MFSLHNQLELRRVTISSLITCIYLPSIVTVISYKGLLYSVGKGSSAYILVLIAIAEILKAAYLNCADDAQGKKKTKSSIFDMSLFFVGATFCFFVGIILFGAPVLDCHEGTLMLSILLTLLTLFPLICHCGNEAAMQLLFGIKSYGKDTIVEMLVNNAMLTVCGAWVGAVVIPLDWNTPWQEWPIPCYLGALGGFLLSNVLTVFKITLMSASQKYPVLGLVVNVMNKFRKITN